MAQEIAVRNGVGVRGGIAIVGCHWIAGIVYTQQIIVAVSHAHIDGVHAGAADGKIGQARICCQQLGSAGNKRIVQIERRALAGGRSVTVEYVRGCQGR